MFLSSVNAMISVVSHPLGNMKGDWRGIASSLRIPFTKGFSVSLDGDGHDRPPLTEEKETQAEDVVFPGRRLASLEEMLYDACMPKQGGGLERAAFDAPISHPKAVSAVFPMEGSSARFLAILPHYFSFASKPMAPPMEENSWYVPLPLSQKYVFSPFARAKETSFFEEYGQITQSPHYEDTETIPIPLATHSLTRTAVPVLIQPLSYRQNYDVQLPAAMAAANAVPQVKYTGIILHDLEQRAIRATHNDDSLSLKPKIRHLNAPMQIEKIQANAVQGYKLTTAALSELVESGSKPLVRHPEEKESFNVYAPKKSPKSAAPEARKAVLPIHNAPQVNNRDYAVKKEPSSLGDKIRSLAAKVTDSIAYGIRPIALASSIAFAAISQANALPTPLPQQSPYATVHVSQQIKERKEVISPPEKKYQARQHRFLEEVVVRRESSTYSRATSSVTSLFSQATSFIGGLIKPEEMRYQPKQTTPIPEKFVPNTILTIIPIPITKKPIPITKKPTVSSLEARTAVNFGVKPFETSIISSVEPKYWEKTEAREPETLIKTRGIEGIVSNPYGAGFSLEQRAKIKSAIERVQENTGGEFSFYLKNCITGSFYEEGVKKPIRPASTIKPALVLAALSLHDKYVRGEEGGFNLDQKITFEDAKRMEKSLGYRLFPLNYSPFVTITYRDMIPEIIQANNLPGRPSNTNLYHNLILSAIGKEKVHEELARMDAKGIRLSYLVPGAQQEGCTTQNINDVLDDGFSGKYLSAESHRTFLDAMRNKGKQEYLKKLIFAPEHRKEMEELGIFMEIDPKLGQNVHDMGSTFRFVGYVGDKGNPFEYLGTAILSQVAQPLLKENYREGTPFGLQALTGYQQVMRALGAAIFENLVSVAKSKTPIETAQGNFVLPSLYLRKEMLK